MTSVSEILSSDWVHRLGWTLLHSLWQIAALASVLALLLAVLRRRTANLRYVTACAGLLVMLVLPAVTYCLVPDRPLAEVTAERVTPPLIAEPSPPPAAPLMAEPPPVAVPNVPDRASVPAVDPPMVPLPPPATPLPERVLQTISPWMPWLAVAWCVGVFVLSLWHLGGWIALQRLKHLGTTPAPEPLAHRLAELIERMQLSRPVRMLQSAVVDVAAVIGWFRPVLLVPAAMLAEMSPRQIDAVLAHELAHIRRYDYLVNLLQTVIETLLFYHPAVWWLSRRIRIEREHCCDDAAVAVCGSKLEYAEALKAVEQARAAPRLAVAATGADDAGTALGRVRRVLGLSTRDSLWSRSWLGGSVTVLLLAAMLVSCMAWAREKERAKTFESAEVTMGFPPDGQEVPKRTMVVKTPRQLRELQAFFPKLGSGRKSSIAGGWEGSVTIQFTRADGSMVRVTSDYTYWSEGAGDWRLKRDLGKFIKELFSPEVEAEVRLLEAKIREIEAWCVPAKGTLRHAIEKRFGKGVPSESAEAPRKRGVPGSRHWLYEFCENGSLLICYDSESLGEVVSARYLDPHATKDRAKPPAPEEQLRELEPRLKQMQLILAEYKKRFGEDYRNAWGEAVEGVQVRVRADQTAWIPGADPSFQVDIRNQGKRERFIAYPQSCKVEVDGEWHTANFDASGEPRSVGLGGRLTYSLSLGDFLSSQAGDRPVNLREGKHTVRVALSNVGEREERPGYENGVIAFGSRKFEAISNPVQIEIVVDEPAAKGPRLPGRELQDNDLRWGPETDGLRMAARLGPAKAAYALGEKIELEFHVRNVSDHTITIAGFAWRQDAGPDTFVIENESGERLQVGHSWYSGRTPIQRDTLKPGETAVFKSSALALLAEGIESPGHPVGHTVMTAPGRHTLQFNLRFPDGGSSGPDGMPRPTDWQGVLATAPVTIYVGEPPKFALFRVLGHGSALPFGGKEKGPRRKILFSGVSDEGDGSRRFDSMRPEYYPLEGLILDETPLLTEADLAGYDWPKHEIHLKPGVRQRLLRGIKPSVWGVPFAVVAGGEPVYLGAFWTGASSYMANMPTISVDPLQWTLPKQAPNHLPENAIRIENNQVLKPGEKPRDPRANPRLRQALDRAGKLIDPRPGAGPKRDQQGENEILSDPPGGSDEAGSREAATVELVLDKRAYFLGENVLLHYGVTNRGEEPLVVGFGGDSRSFPARPLRFKVVATDENARPVEDPYPAVMSFGGPGGDTTLKPGETRWASLPLMLYCDFDKPGVYKIRVYHDLGWDNGIPFQNMLINELPKGPHRAPIVETTIKLMLPDAEQARQVVAEMLSLSTDRGSWGQREPPRQDVTVLRHPVYLPIVEELARQGSQPGATAVGSIATPEATRALIRLLDCPDRDVAAKSLELLLQRLPLSDLDKENTFRANQQRLARRAWRDEMQPEVVEVGWKLLANKDRPSLINAARIVKCLGRPSDFPRFMKELDRVMEEMKDDPTEQNAYPRPANASGDMILAGWQLIERGAPVPNDPQTPGQAALFMLALGRRADFRPADWQATADELLKHPIPYVRSVTLENLRNVPLGSLGEAVTALLKDEHLAVSIPACELAATTKAERFREPLLEVLRAADDQWLMQAAHRAALACGADRDRVLEICIDQLGRPRGVDSGLYPWILALMIEVVEREGGHGHSQTDWSSAGNLAARWRSLLEANREQIRAGKLFKIGEPPLEPNLFPRGFQFQRKDKPPWPDWSSNATESKAVPDEPAANAEKKGWGPSVEGVQVRLRCDRPRWQIDETITWKIDARNTGKRHLKFTPHAHETVKIDVDGRIFNLPASLGTIRSYELKPGQEHRDISFSVSRRWQLKEHPFDLVPGKHTVKITVAVHPTEGERGEPLQVTSNPVEIAIVADDEQPDRDVRGRVLDHEGKPVAGAQVFLRGKGGVTVVNGRVTHGGGKRVTTDADGRFVATADGEDVTHVVVLAPHLNIWAVPVPGNPREPGDRGAEELTIKLPQPATLKVVFDVPGAVHPHEVHLQEPGGRFVSAGSSAQLQLNLTKIDGEGWKGTGDTRDMATVANPGEVTIDHLAPGVYDFYRYVILRIPQGGGTRSRFADRRDVPLKPGETKVIRLVRDKGQRVEGEIEGLPEGGSGALVNVWALEASGEPEKTGKPKLSDWLGCQPNGRFVTSLLEPGEYRVTASAYAPRKPRDADAAGGRNIRGGILRIPPPDYAGSAEVTIKESGPPVEVRIQMEATPPAAKAPPGRPAEDRAKQLKVHIDSFHLDLSFYGKTSQRGERPSNRLILHVKPMQWTLPLPADLWAVQITKEQAEKIVDHLAAEGFLEQARRSGRNTVSYRRPGYVLWVRAEGLNLYESLGWDLPMLRRLEGFQEVLDGDAAQAMDKLLATLKPQRKQWEAAAAGGSSTSSSSVPQWGQAVEGVQVRLRAEEGTYKLGEKPGLLADFRNQGTRDLELVLAPEWWELECDGIWYGVTVTNLGDVEVLPLAPQRHEDDIPVPLDDRWGWRRKGSREPLTFGPGKHTVRVALQVQPAASRTDPPVRVVSNPVEIEIGAGHSMVWGTEAAGLQAGVRFLEQSPRVHVGEQPRLQCIVRNVSERPIQFTTYEPGLRVPLVRRADGTRVDVQGPVFDGPVRIVQHVLEPGKSVALDVLGCAFCPDHPIYRTNGLTARASTGPGVYKLSCELVLTKLQDADWEGRLETGQLDLEVLSPDPDDLTRRVTSLLKEGTDRFTFKTVYLGDQEKPLRSLRLTTNEPTEGYPAHWTTVRIDRNQAEAIIDHLGAAGYLWPAAAEPQKQEAFSKPSYFFVVSIGDESEPSRLTDFPPVSLGWGLEMLRRLDALRKVFDGDAAQAMDELLAALAPNRKQWETTPAESVLKAGAR